MTSTGTRRWVEAMYRRRKLQLERERLEAAHGLRCIGPTNGKRRCGARIGAFNRSGYCAPCAAREKSRAAAIRRSAATTRDAARSA